MNDSREQTNSNENVETSNQPLEQTNPKRPRSFVKNGDTGDDQENTTNNNNNNEESSIKDSNKRSRRHERRRDNDEDDEVQQPQPVIQSSIVRAEPKEREQRQRKEHRNEPKHHRSKQDENETLNHDKHGNFYLNKSFFSINYFSLVQSNSSPSRHRRRRSPTPPSRVRSSPNDNNLDNSTISPTKINQQDDMKNVQTTLRESSSGKRRHRWENDEIPNEKQTTTQPENLEDELRIISKTSSAQIEPTNQSTDIPQQLEEPIVTGTTAMASKSKWDYDDDDEITTDSIQQNQTQSEQ
jgi:hypothetical protein